MLTLKACNLPKSLCLPNSNFLKQVGQNISVGTKGLPSPLLKTGLFYITCSYQLCKMPSVYVNPSFGWQKDQ
jgi:hypothetical protein